MKKPSKNQEEFRDFYGILDVPKNASEKAIQNAFRRLAQQCHPDRNPGDPEAARKFAEAAKAYKILTSQDTRNEVDARIIAEFCNAFLGSFTAEKKPKKKYKTEFERLLKK